MIPKKVDFERLFDPRSVAIVGASANETSISGQPLKYLLAHGFGGSIYPVNPRYAQVGGYKCYPDLESLPQSPDVVVIAVAAKRVPAVLQECGRAGARFAIILTSGFAETGDAGLEAQRRISAIAEQWGLVVIGPNCQGMMNIAGGVRLGFGAPFGISYRTGPVSLVSQSGAFGNAVLMLAEEAGLGFRRYVSTGNESSTTSLDLIDTLIDDEGTELVAAYVEGFKDARRLREVGRKALAANKPLLMWKVGNSQSGARAAASHTANLCGTPELYRAAFRQSGIVQVHDIDELTDCAKALLTGARPAGPGVAVITMSGGAGIAMADRCEELGLTLPSFSEETAARLRPLLPEFATVQNPLDLTAGIGDNIEAFAKVLEVVAADPGVNAIAIPMAAVSGQMAQRFADQLADAHASGPVPIFVAWNARAADAAQAYARLEQAGMPRYSTPARCARGLAATVHFARAQRLAAAHAAPVAARMPQVQWPGGRELLTEFQSKQVLAQCGVGVTREFLATTPERAVASALELAAPVAMKIQSPQLPHKSEAGGVKVNVSGEMSVASAFHVLMENARRFAPEAQLDGVLVQEMVLDGIETIIGGSNTPEFGPVVMFGLGGIFTEVLKDVTFRLAPIARPEAEEMIREIRAFEVLNGARGRPKGDLDALASTLVAVSDLLASEQGTVRELDINPLFVLAQGEGVRAGDALIRIRPPDTPAGRTCESVPTSAANLIQS